MLMDLETAFALLETDEIGPESLPGIAAQGLQEGTDSPSLRLLAGIKPFDPRDARDLFNRAMVELGISMQPYEAAIIAARWLAGQCLNGALSPRDACSRIWRVYMSIPDHPGSIAAEGLQTLAEAGAFAHYLEIPELRSTLGGRDQIERDAIAVLRRLASGDEAQGAETSGIRTEWSAAQVSSQLNRSVDVPAVSRRAHPGSLRPAFVLALAIILVPMLILFGFGFLNDISSPWRFVAAPTYAVGAFVAPVVFVKRGFRFGVPQTNAIAGGLAMAAIVLLADLVFFSANGGPYGAALVVAVTGGAMAFAATWKPGLPPPAVPGLTPPRPDR